MLAPDDIRALTHALGLVVIVPLADGSLSVDGRTPEWLQRLGGGELNDAEHAMTPFLEVFLPDARAFWDERRGGRLRSGIFTVPDGERDCHFEISALTINERHVLLLEHLNDDYSETQEVYQKAREGFLLFKKSLETTAALEAGKREAEAGDRSTAETLGHWCEEMRRPVNAVVASSDVLLEQELSQAQRGMVEVIQRNTRTLLGLIDNAVDFSRSARGHGGAPKAG
jgi:signal transduction histidine kinase